MKKIILLIHKYWMPLTILALIAITVTSLTPLKQLIPIMPMEPIQKIHLPFSEKMHKINLFNFDKTYHLFVYACLMFPTALRIPRYWWLIGLCFIGYSGVIELLQAHVHRGSEWLDLLANSGGVAIGALLGGFLHLRSRDFLNKPLH